MSFYRYLRVTWGFLYVLVFFPIRYVSHVSCMYPACIVHVFRSVPFIYIKIHQDTTRYIVSETLAIIGNVSYLGICILL